ncbi:hypothetical protein [Opitutus sp. GAS368]|uniref:hypothetical protein n=1 Tax=Opitutus sp. GAS368 TaxID=1882749 RepID=UPI00087ACA15|nr:hypothetical protein [Opitutus sp. GAS368]SDR76813.1 hypothetical protein SAMN05444173_0801 [Opitutus sp. GAS368]
MDSLDPKMLIYGVACLGFFATWLLGRQVETLENAFDSLPAALVAFGALLMSPFFFYYAWQQVGAKARLVQEHLPVCEALGHAVGAQGGRPPRGIWRFEARDDVKNILAYYEAVTTTAGWKVERKKNGVLLTKAGDSAAIWWEPAGDGQQIVIQKPAPPVR